MVPTNSIITGQWQGLVMGHEEVMGELLKEWWEEEKLSHRMYELRDPGPNDIVMNVSNTEMLRVTEDGFYVRGVRVEVDEHEAKTVYEAFKSFLAWAELNRR